MTSIYSSKKLCSLKNVLFILVLFHMKKLMKVKSVCSFNIGKGIICNWVKPISSSLLSPQGSKRILRWGK